MYRNNCVDLPFKNKYWTQRDEEKHGKYEDRLESLPKEKDMKGDEIRQMLMDFLKANNFLVATERNYSGQNEHPFDLAAGDEKTLTFFGFEVKGDTDNFSRLKHQLDAYLFVCDGVYLVLHKKKPPEWLPKEIGIIRVFENGEIFIEESSWIRDQMDISTDYEWEALFKANELGISSKRTQQVLGILNDVRRNILFNRYFALAGPRDSKTFEKFYPLTDEQKAVLIGFDVPYHYKLLSQDLGKLEKRLAILKDAISIGEPGARKISKR
jgi:hypothetical protein